MVYDVGLMFGSSSQGNGLAIGRPGSDRAAYGATAVCIADIRFTSMKIRPFLFSVLSSVVTVSSCLARV